HQGLGPVHAGAQERGDGGGVARAGEVQQRRLRRGVAAVVLALASAAGLDDAALLVALHVHFAPALPAGQGAGGELLDQALIVRTQAPYLREGRPAGVFVVVEPAVAEDHVWPCCAGLRGCQWVGVGWRGAVPEGWEPM